MDFQDERLLWIFRSIYEITAHCTPGMMASSIIELIWILTNNKILGTMSMELGIS